MSGKKLFFKAMFILPVLIFSSLCLCGEDTADDRGEGAWEITLNTDSIEYILLNPEKILADPDHFWETDPAYILAGNWHRSTKIPKTTRDYYNKWLSFLKELAAVPKEERKNHEAFKFLETLKKKISIYYEKSIPHIKSFLPKNSISFKAGIYITTKTFPFAFMTSGNMVIDVMSPKFNMDPDQIFNSLTHETFHIGYGYNRYLRREIPLEDGFIYNTLLDSLQNEGMAVYMAYNAQSFFPSAADQDYRLLQDMAEVEKRFAWVNDIFTAAEKKELSGDALREKSWELGVNQRGYYVTGAYMARAIDRKLGREILLKTVSEGPLSFIDYYNKIAEKGMKIHRFKSPQDLTLLQELKLAVFAADREKFNKIVNLIAVKDSSETNVQDKLVKLGYSQVYQEKWDWAINIFKVGTDLFPGSANAWDCLAEAYLGAGELDQSEKYYKKALELDPGLSNAGKMLEEIKERKAKVKANK